MSMLFRLRPDSGRSLIIRTTRLLICGALLSLSGLIQAADRDPVTLTLAEAFARVLSDNPELAMYPYDIRAAEARALQAGFRPNPQVSLDVENIAIRCLNPVAHVLVNVGRPPHADVGG